MDKKAKINYLILGIGVGIILSSTIYSFFPKIRSVELNNDEIIQKARELGMVTLTESLNTGNYSETEMNEEELNETGVNEEEIIENESEDIIEEETLEEENTVKPKEAVVEATKDKADKAVDGEITNEEISENVDGDYVSIYVEKGDSSYTISRKLFEAGLIDDYKGFIDYVKDNNSEGILLYGRYDIRKSSTYEEILKMLITRRK